MSTGAIWRWCTGCRTPPTPGCGASRGVSFEAGGIVKIATQLARHRTDRQRQAVVWDEGGATP